MQASRTVDDGNTGKGHHEIAMLTSQNDGGQGAEYLTNQSQQPGECHIQASSHRRHRDPLDNTNKNNK